MLTRFIEAPGEGVTGCGPAHPGEPSGSHAHRFFRPKTRVVVVTGKKMRVGDAGMHPENKRIEWAQAYGPRHAFNRVFRLARVYLQPTAHVPRSRQIGVENKRPIEIGDPVIELVGDIGKRETAPTERRRVVIA